MDKIQVICCLVAIAICVLLDVLCGTTGHTLASLAVIALVGMHQSYIYRKECDEAEARKEQYQRKIKR